MTKTVLSVIFMAAIMLTAGIAASVDMTGNASAAKAKGIETTKYGSKTNVCGLQLCSEYPGGKKAWEEEQKDSKSVEEPKRDGKNHDSGKINEKRQHDDQRKIYDF